MSTVPHLAGQSRIFTRCPASQMSREMRQMSRIFLNGGYYFLRCRLFYMFALERNKVTNKARYMFIFLRRRLHQHCYRDVPWVVDSHWIITSVLRITCARCFPYSRDVRWRRRRAPVEKMAPKRKCKFNEDWRSLDSKVA